jgi:hypothetical protein
MKNKTTEIQEPNVGIYENDVPYGVLIITGESWYKRLWYFISNPLRYLFKGKIKI